MTASKGRPGPPSLPHRWAKLREAAEYAGVSYQTIYRMTKDGRLPVYRAGTSRVLRVDLLDVDEKVMRKCPTINDPGYELPGGWR
jgi:excisionase family DNA binding protein